jgi:hypothetical protein
MPLDAARDELIVVQGHLIVMLARRNAELEDRTAELETKVSEMEGRLERLERALSRNSGNSSLPPSSDDQPGKKQPAPRPERGSGKRKPGGQSGAPGSHLAWSEAPDEKRDLFPAGACGRDLADADGLGVAASRQVIDTPVVTARTVQYDGHAVACRCGKVHFAAAPDGAGEGGTVSYGPNLQAWAVFLLVMHHVPIERCADVIGALAGVRPSDGFVHSLPARAAKAVRGANC